MVLSIINMSPRFRLKVPLNKINIAPKNIARPPQIFIVVVFSPKKWVKIKVKIISDNKRIEVLIPEVFWLPIKNRE